MKLESGMIIQATVEEISDYSIKLVYENSKGIIGVEDLGWTVSTQPQDYAAEGDLLKVKVTDVFRNRRISFVASLKALETPPSGKMIGYWSSSPSLRWPETQQFPHPEMLIDLNWHHNERRKIAEYLRSGWTHTQWRGVSFCRFQCDISSREMGSKCLTDGEWTWPEGLVHYVEKHGVQLPEEFIDTMRKYEWNAQNCYKEPYQVPKGEYDFSYWIEWSSRFG